MVIRVQQYHLNDERMRDANAAKTLLEKRPEKTQTFERDWNPQPMRYRCNPLPTELSKPHESNLGFCPLCSVGVLGLRI